MKRPRNGVKTLEDSGPQRTPAKPAPHHVAATARTTIRSDSDEVHSHAPEAAYRPPKKNGRWPKGKSGNDKGRKKGSKNQKTIIIEIMETKLGRKIPDPKKLSRYEAMMFKAIQKALGGDIRSMGFVLTEYRKAIESSGTLSAAATTEEDQQAYDALCTKLRHEIKEEVRKEVRNEVLRELGK